MPNTLHFFHMYWFHECRFCLLFFHKKFYKRIFLGYIFRLSNSFSYYLQIYNKFWQVRKSKFYCLSCIFNMYITINQLDSTRSENWGRPRGQNLTCCTIAINVGQNAPKVRSVKVKKLSSQSNYSCIQFPIQLHFFHMYCFHECKFHIL